MSVCRPTGNVVGGTTIGDTVTWNIPFELSVTFGRYQKTSAVLMSGSVGKVRSSGHVIEGGVTSEYNGNHSCITMVN